MLWPFIFLLEQFIFVLILWMTVLDFESFMACFEWDGCFGRWGFEIRFLARGYIFLRSCWTMPFNLE